MTREIGYEGSDRRGSRRSGIGATSKVADPTHRGTPSEGNPSWEQVSTVPGTGIRVLHNTVTREFSLQADDQIGRSSARLYTDWRGNRQTPKPQRSIVEHRGESLSEVYRSKDDPSDWGQTFVYTATVHEVDAEGRVKAEQIVHEDVNVALCPLGSNELFGYEYGANLLVREWVNR